MQRRELFLTTLGTLFLSRVAEARSLGRPMRAILVTSGKYGRYRRVLISFLEGLASLGVLAALPETAVWEALRKESREDTEDVWLAAGSVRPLVRLQCLADGHYDYDFQPALRREVAERVQQRLRDRADVDMIFTFGTAASEDMARLRTSIPVVSLASSDPVATGIILSAEDAGQDNLHAVVIRDFIRWQVTNLKAILPFDRLGFVCAAGDEKKSGYVEAEKAARALGADFVGRTYRDDPALSDEARFPAFFEALRSLADEGVRTVMVPWFPATDAQLAGLVRYMVEKGLYGFSLSGPAFVSRGFLLGVGEENFNDYGLFEARVVQRILNGEKPRDIGQIFVRQNRFSINLRTAMQLGWKVPFELLATADKAYTSQSAVR